MELTLEIYVIKKIFNCKFLCLTSVKISAIINKLICGDAGIGRQASLRCLCQYWRVGSSPISRTSVKDIRFFECPLFLYLNKSANYYHQKQSRWNRTKSLILWKRNLFRSQTGKPQVPQSVLACGFKSHFPHQCKGHSFFRVSFVLYACFICSIILK